MTERMHPNLLEERMARRRQAARARGLEQLDASMRRLEVEHVAEREVVAATGGDPQSLRGIPVIGRGCGTGAVGGSIPHVDGLTGGRRG